MVLTCSASSGNLWRIGGRPADPLKLTPSGPRYRHYGCGSSDACNSASETAKNGRPLVAASKRPPFSLRGDRKIETILTKTAALSRQRGLPLARRHALTRTRFLLPNHPPDLPQRLFQPILILH